MSLKYRDKNGALTVLAGLTPGGNLEAGAVATRKGTTSVPSTSADSDVTVSVAFTDAMPDEDYEVNLHATADFIIGRISNQTANGFTVTLRNARSSSSSGSLDWYAFKTYSVAHAEQNASDIADIKGKIPSTASSSNKLATSNELSSLGTTIDGRLDALEGTIPSSASLQNQLITETALTTALQGKQDTLTFDDTPTEDSSNPVTSDGIYDALTTKAAQTEVNDISDEIADMNNILGAKNILSNNAKSQTINGVTCTVNSDGSISTNGVYTGSDGTLLRINLNFTVPQSGEYILTGTPFIQQEWTFLLYITENNGSIIAADLGQGLNCSLDSSKTYSVVLWCKSNFDTSGYNIKPMIRLASIQDDTYEPYTLTNQQMTPYVQSVSNPNLLDNPWFTINQRGASTYTAYGYTFDRWHNNSTSNYISVSEDTNGMHLVQTASSSNGFLRQIFETPLPAGIYTLSADVVSISGRFIIQCQYDDSSYSVSPTFSTTGITSRTINTGTKKITRIFFQTYAGTDAVIRAVKLERGTVSTLANDVAPNYATELEKCRRYFRSIYIAELLARINDGGANIRFPSMLIDGLRPGSKTVRFKDESNPDFSVRLSGGGTQFTLIWNTDFSLTIDGDTGMNINFALTADGKEKVKDIKNQIVGIWNYSNYIWVSADL